MYDVSLRHMRRPSRSKMISTGPFLLPSDVLVTTCCEVFVSASVKFRDWNRHVTAMRTAKGGVLSSQWESIGCCFLTGLNICLHAIHACSAPNTCHHLRMHHSSSITAKIWVSGLDHLLYIFLQNKRPLQVSFHFFERAVSKMDQTVGHFCICGESVQCEHRIDHL